MLPCLSRGDRYVTMDEVRAGHTHDLDVVSGNEVVPICMCLTEAEGVDRVGQSIIGGVVSNGYQSRPQRRLGIVLSQPRVGACMHLTHPAPAHDAHPQWGRFFGRVVARHWWNLPLRQQCQHHVPWLGLFLADTGTVSSARRLRSREIANDRITIYRDRVV